MTLSFLKQKGYFQLLEGKSSDRTVYPYQSNNWYGSQHSQNTPHWHFFSWNDTVSPRSVSHSSETAGKHVFVNLGIGA